MSFRFAELVGCYRLQVSDELLAFIERRFVQPAPPNEEATVRGEALAEAQAAELEIQADGTVISRAGSQEFYRVRLPHTEGELSELTFEKAPGLGVRLLFLPPDSLTAIQPDKPDATFRRT
jgi:hypothetical protein